MAARFWVTGGTGNWNDTSNWSTTSGGASGASVPGSSDNAALNANSGSGTVTLDISPTIQTLTCTGFTGTLAFGTNTISLNSTGTIFTGATTMTVTGTPLIILNNNTASARTVTPGAVTEANSISFRIISGTGSMVLTAGSYRDIDFTDGTNPTGFAGNVTNTALTIYGNFKASTGMTRTAGVQAYTFAATSGTKTINTAGVTFDCPFTFNGVGGTWQLQSALTSGATRTCTLTNGTLDLASYTLTTGLFSSNNSNVRALAFGAGKVVLTNNGGTILSMSTATNFSYTGTSRIECNYSGSTGTRTIIPPATNAVESNALNIYVTAGTDTVTVSGACRFLTFDLTGFSGTLTYASTSRYFGDLVFSSGMALGTVSGTLTFAKTSGTQTITSNGKAIGNSVTVDAPGATVSLQDAFSITGTLSLTNGSLATNGYTVTTASVVSNNANTRSLNLGASVVTLTGSGTPWNFLDATNLTFTAGTSAITTTSNTGTITFNGGGLTYYNVTFGATYYNCTLTGANTFNNLTIDSPAAAGRRNINVNANQTVNGTLTAVGSAANSRPRFTGLYTGSTITAAAVSLADTDFGNIIAAGASSPWSGTRLGDFGYNTNITFAAPKTVYWNQPAGGNWSDVAWATSSGGAVNVNNFPLSQDTAVLDNTGVGASTTIVMDYGWIIGALSAGSLTNALTINWNCFGALAASSQGNFTLSSAITLTYTQGSLGFTSSQGSTAVITTAGVAIPMPNANFNAASKTIQLADNFTSTGTSVGLVAGTLDLNGKTLSCVTFDSTFTDLEVRVLAFNGGQIDVTGNAATVWACADLTGFSYTGAPTVNFTYSGSTGTRVISNGNTAGATESNVVNINVNAGSDTISFSSGSSIKDLVYTGFSGLGTIVSSGFIYGNLTLSPTQTSGSSVGITTFAATSGTKTITTNGVTIDRPITFDGVGGTWTLQDALTMGATRELKITNGTFNTGNYNITAGLFTSANSNVRTINLGSSTITLLESSNSTVGLSITTNLTFNAGTSTFDLAGTGVTGKYFQGGGLTFYKVRISGNSPTFLTGGLTRFQELSNTVTPLSIAFGNLSNPMYFDNFLISGTAGNLVTLQSSTPGTQFLLAKNTGGKVLVSFCSITDSAVTPAGYWFAPTSQGNVDGGNNTGWNFGATGQNTGFMMFM